MARYRLSIPQEGDTLHNDDSTITIVAATIESARDHFRDYTEDEQEPVYLHCYIGRCRVLYKADIDGGDGIDGSKPGDTIIDPLCDDDGRALGEADVRCWELGAPSWHWEFDYSPPEPVSWREVPVECGVYHRVMGHGRIVARPWKGAYGVHLPVRFGWPAARGPVRQMPIGCVSLSGTATWPGDRRRVTVTVNGEVVATGVREKTAEILRDMRCSRLTAEWEAEQYAAYEARAVTA